MTYRFNYDSPAINFDLNWFVLTGSVSYAPMWLGYCGKLSDKLFERPVFSYKLERSYSIPPEDLPEGTYHYEEKYNHYTGNISNMSIANDNDGYPTGITYSVDIEEYVYSYDYVVDIDTVYLGPGTKGGDENIRTYTHSRRIEGTERNESTGRIVGTNDIVYSFEYKQ